MNDIAPMPQSRLALEQACTIAQPLATWLLRSGVGHREFSIALKAVFLQAAQAELERIGGKQTDSALSLLAGLHRKDVRALLPSVLIPLPGAGPEAGRPTPAAELVTRWLTELDGRPLPFSGKAPSFESLASSVSQDIRPRTLLLELVRLGVVEDAGQEVRLVQQAFVPNASQDDAARMVAGSTGDHIAAAVQNLTGTDGKKHLVTNQACFGCTIACGRISKMDENHFTIENKPQYRGASGGLEYEAAWALGAANGVNDLEALQYVNMLCNEEGIDPITFGTTIGAVMELYAMGILTKEQLGTEATFGSARALAFLAEETVNGRGFGKEIGQGSKRLTAKYGHPELSMSSKGQEFPAYDGRAIQGIGLAYATSNRGGCHLRGYTIASEVLGIPVKTDPLESQGKPELVKAFQDATAAFDSSGLCIFTTFAWGLQDLSPQMQGACGEQYTVEELAKIGERIWNMEREFNNRAGFTSKDDSLPARLTSVEDACKTGPAKGKFNELATMLPLYYEARGWDSEGRPTAATKERLGL